jgi:hypothetical protein
MSIFSKATNSKKQGDMGLGFAICYFVSKGYTTSLPLTDSQDYDLIVDIDNKLCKVQVKTTSYKRSQKDCKNSYWTINLSVKGGNRSYNTIKKFDNLKVDYLFIITSEMDKYLIPCSELSNAKHSLTLYKPWDKFKL